VHKLRHQSMRGLVKLKSFAELLQSFS
jgi:hypothetical protein